MRFYTDARTNERKNAHTHTHSTICIKTWIQYFYNACLLQYSSFLTQYKWADINCRIICVVSEMLYVNVVWLSNPGVLGGVPAGPAPAVCGRPGYGCRWVRFPVLPLRTVPQDWAIWRTDRHQSRYYVQALFDLQISDCSLSKIIWVNVRVIFVNLSDDKHLFT